MLVVGGLGGSPVSGWGGSGEISVDAGGLVEAGGLVVLGGLAVLTLVAGDLLEILLAPAPLVLVGCFTA